MFRASLCPSSGEQEQDWLKIHVLKLCACMWVQRVAPTYKRITLAWSQPTISATTIQRTLCLPMLQASSHEVLTSLVLVLLMIGIMLPEI
jgi:hypothetical protein